MSGKKEQGAELVQELAHAVEELERAEDESAAVRSRRDLALQNLDQVIPRREMARLTGLSPARIQQIIDEPWTHRVGFSGVLEPSAEKALKEAGVVLRGSRGVGATAPGDELPPMLKHGVYLRAKSNEDALRRVKRALKGKGSFAAFEAQRVST